MSSGIKGEVKLLAKHSAIYGVARILDRAIGFFMIPVYTRFLAPADYGVLELIYMTVSLIGMVVGVGITSAVTRFYFDHKDEEKRNVVISTAIIAYGGMVGLIVLLLLPFGGFVGRVVLQSDDGSRLILVALITMAADIVFSIVLAYLRAQHASLKVTGITLTKTVLTLSLNIYFLVFLEMGVFGILLASLVANLLFATGMVIDTLRRTGMRIDFPLMVEMLRFGGPLIPSNVAAYLVHSSDRYFIGHYVAVSQVGIYSLGYKFGSLINQLVNAPFTQIWNPRRIEKFDQGDVEKHFAKIFTYFCTLNVFAALMLSLLSRELIQVMAAPEYWDAYKVVPIIALSYVIFSFHYHFNIGILAKKKTKFIAYTNVLNGGLNLVLNIALIPRFGVWGAAWATLFCFTFKITLTYIFSNRLHPILVEWRRVITVFLVGGVVYGAGVQIDLGSIWLNAPAHAAAGLGMPLLLVVARFFSQEELALGRRLLFSKLGRGAAGQGA